MKNINRIVTTAIVVIFIVAVVILFRSGQDSLAVFYESKIMGRVKMIKLSPRQIPDILVDGNYYYLDHYQPNIREFIQVGDSVCKESQSWTLKIFRINGDSVVGTTTWE